MSFSLDARRQTAADAARTDRRDLAITPTAAERAAFADGAHLAPQSLFEFDRAANMLRWASPESVARLLGVDVVVTHSPADAHAARLSGDQLSLRTQAYAGQIESYACEYMLRRDDGALHWVEERGGWIGLGAGRRLIGLIRSIENQRRRDERLAWFAHNDELTGLLTDRTCADGSTPGLRAQSRRRERALISSPGSTTSAPSIMILDSKSRTK